VSAVGEAKARRERHRASGPGDSRGLRSRLLAGARGSSAIPAANPDSRVRGKDGIVVFAALS
jgi:hypothetical protein